MRGVLSHAYVGAEHRTYLQHRHHADGEGGDGAQRAGRHDDAVHDLRERPLHERTHVVHREGEDGVELRLRVGAALRA